MSGGNLDYFYSRFDEPLEKISKEIKWGKNKWSPEVLSEFQNAIKYLKIAQVYSHDVEWLLSGDYGDDSFLESIKEELEALEKNSEIIEPHLKNVHYVNILMAKNVLITGRWDMWIKKVLKNE